jgi:ribosomal protein S12 methylthiotransferase accessory factor
MARVRVTWRPDAPDAEQDEVVAFVSHPRFAPEIEFAATLRDLDDGSGSSGAAPVVMHPLFGETIVGCVRVPHRYIHFSVATALDGTFGEGSSTEPHRAMETSLCEVMERCLGRWYDRGALTFGTCRDLAPNAVDPRALVLLRPWEHDLTGDAYVRYTDDLPLHWCQGYRFDGDRLVPRLLPATLAILKFSWRHKEERFAPSLSPGTASGPTYVHALLHGLYELVERDAFMIAWLNRLACPRLEVQALPTPGLRSSLARLRADGFEVTFVDLTTELGIPVVLAVIGRPPGDARGSEYLAFGLGANLSVNRALERAYIEALEIMVSFYDFADSRCIRVKELEVGGDLDLTGYFRSCRFLLASPEVKPVATAMASPVDPTGELETCLAGLRRSGVDTYFVDLTPPALRAFRYRLVRVMASNLQPHLYELDCFRLDNPRLYSAPVAAGHRVTPIEEHGLNLVPNPFAVLDHARVVGLDTSPLIATNPPER